MSDEDFCPPYKLSGSRHVTIVGAGAVPTEFALYQNYPNPFNATTQIRYALHEVGQVRLDVYNLLGQRVATLVDDFQEVGHHSVNWDAGHVASGLYLYRLQTPDFTSTRKMVLLK
jgi:hypothetical protein